jgi:hypothetical protein
MSISVYLKYFDLHVRMVSVVSWRDSPGKMAGRPQKITSRGATGKDLAYWQLSLTPRSDCRSSVVAGHPLSADLLSRGVGAGARRTGATPAGVTGNRAVARPVGRGLAGRDYGAIRVYLCSSVAKYASSGCRKAKPYWPQMNTDKARRYTLI